MPSPLCNRRLRGLKLGPPGGRTQSLWLRQNLARLYQSAGQMQAADQTYQQVTAGTADPNNAAQAVIGYSDFLSSTGHADKAESMLNGYLASHADMQPWLETNFLSSLANVARNAGNPQRAQEYEEAARAKQPAPPSPPPGQTLIFGLLAQAQTAINNNKPDEAFSLTMQAIAEAPPASDRDNLMNMAPYIATNLAFHKAPERAELIFQELLRLAGSWSADTIQPLLAVQQQYARFLMQQERWGDLDRQMERLRDTAIAADGPQGGLLASVQHLAIDTARVRNQPQAAVTVAKEMTGLEELLSGNTSAAYLNALETQAGVLEWSGNFQQAMPLRKKNIPIADLVLSQDVYRRGSTRMAAALALAHEHQFDEAEALARQAVALSQSMQPPQPGLFSQQLEQILRIKKGGQPGTAASPWFTKGEPGVPGSIITGVFGASPVAPPPAVVKPIDK